MFDLKVIHSVLDQLDQERGIPKEKVMDAIENALATAYKKEYGKRGQIVRAHFDLDTGAANFEQVKIVVDRDQVRMPEERHSKEIPGEGYKIEESDVEAASGTRELGKKGGIDSKNAEDENEEDAEDETDALDEEDQRINFNPEHHILLEDALKIKKDVAVDDEIIFALEPKDQFGRIAAQTAKQVIIQKIREAERDSVLEEFSAKQGDIISGIVQRIERGVIYVDLGRATGLLPIEEQIPTERYRLGERMRAYLCSVEEGAKGVFLRLSRSHPQFLAKLFAIEAPEISTGVVEIKAIAREPGSRSKIAVASKDDHIDPVGSLVGQRGVRVSTVTSELGGEKIDVIEWSAEPAKFVADALSPARILNVTIDEQAHRAVVEVLPDQQSLSIGKGGQNARLAAKLTGWKIDIRSVGGVAGSSPADDRPVDKPEESAEATETVGNKQEDSTEAEEPPTAIE